MDNEFCSRSSREKRALVAVAYLSCVRPTGVRFTRSKQSRHYHCCRGVAVEPPVAHGNFTFPAPGLHCTDAAVAPVAMSYTARLLPLVLSRSVAAFVDVTGSDSCVRSPRAVKTKIHIDGNTRLKHVESNGYRRVSAGGFVRDALLR